MTNLGRIARSCGRLSLACCCLSAAGIAVAGLFPHPVYPVGDLPLRVHVEDLNRDGHPDVVCANDTSDDITILLADANGDLKQVATLGPVDIDRFQHTGLASGDFNGDAIPDIVVGASNPTFFFGFGDGSFGPAEQVLTQFGSRGVAVADLNGDGMDDLVSGGSMLGGGQTISVLLGNGDGTFQAEGQYPTGTLRDIVAGDFNEDGAPDLMTANVSSDDVSLLIGIGDGTFAAQVRLLVGDNPFRVVAGDFDGDENLDVATLNDRSDDATVLFGAGDGSFPWDTTVPIGNLPQAVLARDLDQDGRDDLVATTRDSDGALVYLGQADRSFTAIGAQGVAGWPQSIGAGDFDRDGVLDLVLPATFQDTVEVIMGVGDGTLEPYPIIDSGSGNAIAVDVDRDGRTDVVSVNNTGALVFLGNGDGSFASPSVASVVGAPSAVTTADFNDDDEPDLAVSVSSSAEVSVLLGTGGGSFADELRFPAVTAVALISDDFNGDLDADLVLLPEFGDDVTVLLGNGDGTFGAPTLSTVPNDDHMGLASGDFNQDGDRDLAVTNLMDNDVSILLGNGDGTFGPETRVAVGTNPWGIAVVDLDGDALDDLVVANCGCIVYGESPQESDFDVSVRLGNGDGTFGPDTRYATGTGPAGIAVADLDGDGHTDMTTVGNAVSVLLADGAGGFREPLTFDPGSDPLSVGLGDFEGDGRVDLVVSRNVPSSSTFVAVLLGQGTLPPVVRFDADKTRLVWPAVLGADSYTVYRGWLSDLVDFDLDGLPDSGYGNCQGGVSPDPGFTDSSQPAPDEGWFYVVGFVGPLGETGLGTTSQGLARQPAIACP